MRITNHLPAEPLKPTEKPAARAKSEKLEDAASLELSGKAGALDRKAVEIDAKSLIESIKAAPQSAFKAQANLDKSRISGLLA